MEAFLIKLVIYVAITFITSYLFAEDGPDDPGTEPGDFEAPVVTASDVIPVLFGTQILKAPNVVWYGNVVSTPWEKCS